MNFSPLFNVFLGIFFFMWVFNNILPSSGGNKNQKSNNQSVTIVSEAPAAEGLDLSLLPGLIKESKNAEELEKKLNEPDGINNLDLNNDQQVDYLKVDEYGDRQQGEYCFSITTEVAEGEVQEVATVDMKQEGDQVKVNAAGNQQIYGSGYGYQSSFGIGSFLMWSYLLSPHGFYRSPYYYNNYPRNYRSPSTVSKNQYQNRAQKFEKTTSTYRGGSSTKSPNYNRTANSGIKRGLRNPTTSQKSFQSRIKSRPAGSGAFGRKSTTTRSRGIFGSRNRSVRGFSGFNRGFGGFGK